jgi:hypothetical protein
VPLADAVAFSIGARGQPAIADAGKAIEEAEQRSLTEYIVRPSSRFYLRRYAMTPATVLTKGKISCTHLFARSG